MEITLLLIDDDEKIRRAMALLLSPHGYQISEAENGEHALSLLAENEYTLILLDHNMPVMTGLEFLQKLRSETASTTPVLMMSGEKNIALRQKAYKLGVYDFIGKPEDADILLARVANGMQIAELLTFRKELKRDLKLSANILRRLLPQSVTQGNNFNLYTHQQSLLEIGGDIALAFAMDTDFPFFVMGDITGHGISAALFGLLIDVAIRRAYREALMPHKILTRLNRELCESLPDSFLVSMFCCAFDARKGVLHYASAGHPSPYLASRGKVAKLNDIRQPVLGVSAYQSYEGNTLNLEKGDWLLMYTDGIFDKFEGNAYRNDAYLDNTITTAISAAGLFGNLQSYLSAQKGVIDDRTIMILEVC
ncbi:MAG: fused response regulator/phosphatase [Turneriella sp.]